MDSHRHLKNFNAIISTNYPRSTQAVTKTPTHHRGINNNPGKSNPASQYTCNHYPNHTAPPTPVPLVQVWGKNSETSGMMSGYSVIPHTPAGQYPKLQAKEQRPL